MKPTCQPGDLAIVIAATNTENLGRIVKVLRTHLPVGDFAIRREPLVWDIEGEQPLVWELRGKLYNRKTGPVPDRLLWPIRENREEMEITRPVEEAQ